MAKIYHADLWGSRDNKYRYLQEHDITTVEWTLKSEALYRFIPQEANETLKIKPDATAMVVSDA